MILTRGQLDALNDAFIARLALLGAGEYSEYIRQIIAGKHPKPATGEIARVVAILSAVALELQGVIPRTRLSDAYIPGAETAFVKFAIKHPPAGIIPKPVQFEGPRSIMYEARILKESGRPQAEIQDTLERRYASHTRAVRALRTEGHEILEKKKNEDAAAVGMKKKTWRTQRDDDVRDTAWHNNVADQEVNIYDDFKAAGMKANHPGDLRLPPGERINCRCYLEYSKD